MSAARLLKRESFFLSHLPEAINQLKPFLMKEDG